MKKWTRIAALCLVVALALGQGAALAQRAETPEEIDDAVLAAVVAARERGKLKEWQEAVTSLLPEALTDCAALVPGTPVEAENHLRFTLHSIVYMSKDEQVETSPGMISVVVVLEAQGLAKGKRSVAERDFLLYIQGGQEEPGYCFPNQVFTIGSTAQEVEWPVLLHEDTGKIMLIAYRMPWDATELTLVMTNCNGEENDLVAQGKPYGYSFRRTANDFLFYNSGSEDVCGLYVKPVEEADWSEEMLAVKYLSLVKSGDTKYITFVGTAYEADDAAEWDIKLVLASGTELIFNGLHLREAINVELKPDDAEPQGYALQMY